MRRDGVNLGRKGEDELRKRTKKLGPKKLVQSPQPIHHITHVSRFSSSTPPVSNVTDATGKEHKKRKHAIRVGVSEPRALLNGARNRLLGGKSEKMLSPCALSSHPPHPRTGLLKEVSGTKGGNLCPLAPPSPLTLRIPVVRGGLVRIRLEGCCGTFTAHS